MNKVTLNRLPMVARLELVNSLGWYASLLQEWDRREAEAVVLRARAEEVRKFAFEGITGGVGAVEPSTLSLFPLGSWGFHQ